MIKTIVSKTPAVNDGLILSTCVVLSSIATYFIMGIEATLWSTLSVLHAYNIFSKPKDYKSYLYSFICSMSILVGIYLGYFLKLGYLFYFALIILSFFYYQLYDIDPALDLSMKYIIIFSTIGTTFTEDIIKGLVVGLLIGTVLTLLVCYSLSHKEHLKTHISTLQIRERVLKFKLATVLRSLVYSAGLIACLFFSIYLNIGHFFWALLTFVFVLHPKSQSIVKLTIQRIAGTLLAVLLLYFLFNTPMMPYIGFVSILILAFLLPMSNERNYAFASFCTTGFVLAVLEMSLYWQTPNYQLLSERILETLLGGFIALICSIILKYVRNK